MTISGSILEGMMMTSFDKADDNNDEEVASQQASKVEAASDALSRTFFKQ